MLFTGELQTEESKVQLSATSYRTSTGFARLEAYLMKEKKREYENTIDEVCRIRQSAETENRLVVAWSQEGEKLRQ